MKIYTRNYGAFAAFIWTVLLLPAHGDPSVPEGVDPVAAWRPSSEDIIVPQDPSRSAFSEEENRILFMMLTAITPPGKAFASDRGRPVDLSADDRRLIGDRLKETIGPRLLPEEAIVYLGAYDRNEGTKTVRRCQLSYQRGSLRVAISGELDGFTPKNITVVLAEANEAPHADNYVLRTPLMEELSGVDVVEVERGVEKRLKTTLLHYKNLDGDEQSR